MSDKKDTAPAEGAKKKKIRMWVFLWLFMPFTAFFKLEELLGGKDEDDKYKEYHDQNEG